MARPNPFASLRRLSVPKPYPRLPPTRSAYTNRGQRNEFSHGNRPLGETARRIIPADAREHFNTRTGCLTTTPQVRDFLMRTKISPDNGIMSNLRGPKVASEARRYDALIYYTPHYVLHPYHLTYFRPRGHALALEMCSRYEIRMREEPLWINVTTYGTEKAVVRLMKKRRLKGAVHRALREMGYDDSGKAEGKMIRGTLGIHIHRPITGINEDPTEFGRVVAMAVERESQRVFGDGIGEGREQEDRGW